MAKQKIPISVQNKFNRQQFNVGDYVYIIFLGQKYYGYVKKITERSGSFVYMVQTHKHSYPCGIQIDQYANGTAGNILIDDTKRLGSEEIKRKFNVKSISANAPRTKRTQSGKNNVRGRNDKATNNEVSQPKRATKHRTKNDDKSSNTANSKGTTTRRRKSYSKLDEAVQKQKDFLRKFT